MKSLLLVRAPPHYLGTLEMIEWAGLMCVSESRGLCCAPEFHIRTLFVA